MSNDFGPLNLVVSPFLERIAREERIGREQPRNARNLKPKPAKKDEASTPPDGAENSEESVSSQHIDLRI